MARRINTNYLNNKDLLAEIHKSKNTFCEYENPTYANFDVIIYDLDVLADDNVCTNYFGNWDITYKETTSIKKEIESKVLIEATTVDEWIYNLRLKKLEKIKKEDPTSDLEIGDILIGNLVFRYMTFNHVPENTEWPEDKIKKKPADGFVKVNFPPFQHIVLENGMPKCVGLSHYKDGEFNLDYGRITNELGKMYMLLVEKISKKGNWRNYTYIDEMRSSALVQLSQVGLQFDEGRAQIPNPFAFYTTVVSNAFKQVLNTEKKNRKIRDELIEMEGETPSFSRQMEEEYKTAKGFYNIKRKRNT